MTQDMNQSKFSMKIVFADSDEGTCVLYERYFRDMKRVEVKQMNILEGNECIVLPMPSCFGLYSEKSGYVNQLVESFGNTLPKVIQTHILRKYLGEQPLGSAFLIKNPGKQNNFRYIIVVALFRALTCAGDDMAWLDPQYVTKDYAYNAMRGILITALRHNAISKKNKISTIYCPDFIKIRTQAPGGDKVLPHEIEETVRQMAMATRGIFEPSKISKTWADAILVTTQIITTQENKDDIELMLETGKLESRGIYSFEELDKVMQFARDSKNKQKQEASINLLASCLHRADTQYNLPKKDIALRISSIKDGCLSIILDWVVNGKINIHTEIDESDLVVGECIGEGTAGSVFRGTWRGKHVAIKKFRKDSEYGDFIKELSIMCIVQHKNLIKCFGGVTKNEKKWIVAELMQTNLTKLLHEKSITIDLGTITEIALSAAEGLDFLHTHCNLMHRDIKSMNLLINTYKTQLDVKLCDFGVSRLISKRQIMTGGVGTVHWIAPEVFTGKKYNQKADIYSFGIILWELLTRESPYGDKSPFSIPISVINGDRPPLNPKSCPPSLYKLIRICWAPKPKQRPSTSKIISALLKFHKSLPLSHKAQVSIDITKILVDKHTLTNKKPSSHTRHPSKSKTIAEGVTSSSSRNSTSLSGAASEIEESEPYKISIGDFENTEPLLVTCNVTRKWVIPVVQLETIINNRFSHLKRLYGKISVENDRFILCQSSGLALEFLESLNTFYEFPSKQETLLFMKNFMYFLGYLVGVNEASDFVSKEPQIDSLLAKNASLIYSAFTGMAFVQLLSSSTFNDSSPEESIILTNNISSFETQSFKKVNLDNTKCNMHAGFLAGWGSFVMGSSRSVIEISCTTKGDSNCTFLDADSKLIEKNLTTYCKNNSQFHKLDIPSNVGSHNKDYQWVNNVVDSVMKLKVKNNSSHLEEFSQPKINKDDLEKDLSSKVESMYIDPASATVELADEPCILLKGDAISSNFIISAHEMLSKYVTGNNPLDCNFTYKFLYILGKCFGRSNCKWFSSIVGIENDNASKLLALPYSLSYLGWSQMEYNDNTFEMKEKDNFLYKCKIYHSFEASSWLHKISQAKKSHKRESSGNDNSKGNKSCCLLHAGYLAGWFEAVSNISVQAVETNCSITGSCCEFVIGPTELMKTKYSLHSQKQISFLEETVNFILKKPR